MLRFNEARALSTGKMEAGGTAEDTSGGFNEARALSTGKRCQWCGGEIVLDGRFNEARALSTGKIIKVVDQFGWNRVGFNEARALSTGKSHFLEAAPRLTRGRLPRGVNGRFAFSLVSNGHGMPILAITA